MRKRNHHISVWLTAEEHDYLKQQASKSGLGIDPFVRNLIMGVNLRPRPPDSYAALLRELSAIGNNVNQHAHQANARDDATKAEISEAAQLVMQAWRLVKESF